MDGELPAATVSVSDWGREEQVQVQQYPYGVQARRRNSRGERERAERNDRDQIRFERAISSDDAADAKTT